MDANKSDCPCSKDTGKQIDGVDNPRRYADEDRAGGRNTMTRHAPADMCTPEIEPSDA